MKNKKRIDLDEEISQEDNIYSNYMHNNNNVNHSNNMNNNNHNNNNFNKNNYMNNNYRNNNNNYKNNNNNYNTANNNYRKNNNNNYSNNSNYMNYNNSNQMNNNYMNNNNMNNYANMNNNYANNNNQMNNNYSNNNNQMNNNYSNNNNMNNNTNNTPQYEYKEKEYKNGLLAKNTKVTKASIASRFLLLGFYLILIVVGIGAFFMIRANKYEFYLKQDSVVINPGSSYQIELVPKNERYFDYLNYDYKIADESIATVDEFGTIIAKKAGKTSLKISLRPGFISSKTVTIITEDVDVETVEIAVAKDNKYVTTDYFDLAVDQSTTIKAIVNGRDDLNVSAKFTSSNTDVAVVDTFGNVTGKRSGKTIITAIVNDVEGTVTINVKGDKIPHIIEPTTEPSPTSNPTSTPTEEPDDTPTPTKTLTPTPTPSPTPKVITNVKFQESNIDVKKGSTVQLSAIITPTELSSSNLTWTSSNTNIATVNGSGLVTGVNVGSAKITVKTTNGKTATCTINVKTDSVNVTRITLNTTAKTITVGSKFQLVATIAPSNATVRKLIWTSDKESVATVDQNGLVTAKAAGTTTIMVVSSDGKVAAKCTITVQKATSPSPATSTKPSPSPTKATNTTKVTKVSLGVASQINKYVGDQLQLSAAVEPSSITKYTVKWSSSDTSKATVSNTGLVKFKAAGTVDITAEVDGVKAKVTVVIKTKTTTTTTASATTATAPAGTQLSPAEVQLSDTKLTIQKGKTATFKLKMKNSTGQVTVSSSNEKVIKVKMPSGQGEICNANVCLLDAYPGSPVDFVYTIEAVGTGTAYVNVVCEGITIMNSDYDILKSVDPSGKIGVLVK